MMRKDSSTGDRRPLVAVVVAVLILVPLAYSLASFLFARAAASAEPFLERPAEEHESCIRDTEYMRFNHMELLKELRDEGVRGGAKRETSINSCRECHTSRERFCDQCHDAVNLYPDCFECHYYP